MGIVAIAAFCWINRGQVLKYRRKLLLAIAASLPFLFVASLYSAMWLMQIYRAVRRARTSGLRTDYLLGTTVCRLFYFLCASSCCTSWCVCER